MHREPRCLCSTKAPPSQRRDWTVSAAHCPRAACGCAVITPAQCVSWMRDCGGWKACICPLRALGGAGPIGLTATGQGVSLARALPALPILHAVFSPPSVARRTLGPWHGTPCTGLCSSSPSSRPKYQVCDLSFPCSLRRIGLVTTGPYEEASIFVL